MFSHKVFRCCSRQNASPPNVLNPGTCEYVTLLDKKDFSDIIKVTDLKIEGYPGLPKWVQSNHSSPKKQNFLQLAEVRGLRHERRGWE